MKIRTSSDQVKDGVEILTLSGNRDRLFLRYIEFNGDSPCPGRGGPGGRSEIIFAEEIFIVSHRARDFTLEPRNYSLSELRKMGYDLEIRRKRQYANSNLEEMKDGEEISNPFGGIWNPYETLPFKTKRKALEESSKLVKSRLELYEDRASVDQIFINPTDANNEVLLRSLIPVIAHNSDGN